MSTLDIVFLSAAIVAFVVFAAALARAEYRTRNISRPVRKGHAETVAALTAANTGPRPSARREATPRHNPAERAPA